MILFIIIYYFLPALIGTAISRFAYSFSKQKLLGKWLLIALITISWTPAIITGGHGMGFAQIVVALALDSSAMHDANSIWTHILPLSIVFLIVCRCIFRQEKKRHQSN